jgi:CRP/FNR family transcriptional regulator
MNNPALSEQKEILRTLNKSKIFSEIRNDELTKIVPLFEMVHFKNGEYIFMEDDPSNWLYIVSKRRVKIIKHTLSGKDVILELKSPGEMFCCATVLDNKPYPESAQSKGASTAIRIKRRDLLKLIDAYPFLKVGIVNYLNEKLTDAYDMLQSLSTEIVEKRIATILLKLSEKTGSGNSEFRQIDFPLTRREIADMVGTSTETCIRIMSRLQKLGMVQSSRNSILVKAAALQAFLDQ